MWAKQRVAYNENVHSIIHNASMIWPIKIICILFDFFQLFIRWLFLFPSLRVKQRVMMQITIAFQSIEKKQDIYCLLFLDGHLSMQGTQLLIQDATHNVQITQLRMHYRNSEFPLFFPFIFPVAAYGQLARNYSRFFAHCARQEQVKNCYLRIWLTFVLSCFNSLTTFIYSATWITSIRNCCLVQVWLICRGYYYKLHCIYSSRILYY